jgi:hypothetical protein
VRSCVSDLMFLIDREPLYGLMTNCDLEFMAFEPIPRFVRFAFVFTSGCRAFMWEMFTPVRTAALQSSYILVSAIDCCNES